MACLSSLAPMVMAVVGGVLLPSSSQAWSGPSRDLSPAGPAMIWVESSRSSHDTGTSCPRGMLLPRSASRSLDPASMSPVMGISPDQAALPPLPGRPHGRAPAS